MSIISIWDPLLSLSALAFLVSALCLGLGLEFQESSRLCIFIMMFLSVAAQGVWRVWNPSLAWTSLLTTLTLIFLNASLLRMWAIRWCQKVSADSELEGKAEVCGDTLVESVGGGDGVVECGEKRRSSCQVVLVELGSGVRVILPGNWTFVTHWSDIMAKTKEPVPFIRCGDD
ncbi:hypothetical protein B0H14DRAFT_2577099 [Mycena olivaceomarginata]|nr:hypothetical protein B0H14DRAFT_2577099 [Mycena olivaceomarginata]